MTHQDGRCRPASGACLGTAIALLVFAVAMGVALGVGWAHSDSPYGMPPTGKAMLPQLFMSMWLQACFPWCVIGFTSWRLYHSRPMAKNMRLLSRRPAVLLSVLLAVALAVVLVLSGLVLFAGDELVESCDAFFARQQALSWEGARPELVEAETRLFRVFAGLYGLLCALYLCLVPFFLVLSWRVKVRRGGNRGTP